MYVQKKDGRQVNKRNVNCGGAYRDWHGGKLPPTKEAINTV